MQLVFGVIGNATALLLFLAPMITFKRIVMNKSTEQFSSIPYAMTLMNCLLSAWYGLPFISPNNFLVATINIAGTVIESIYVLIFLIFAPKKEKTKLLVILCMVLAAFATIACISLFALHGNHRKILCGVVSTICATVMYASPLSAMRLVIKTKSVEYMPFLLSLFVFICGTCWFIYGFLGRDLFILIPNGLGCGLGAMQLIIYAIYRNNKGESNKSNINGSLEMGLEGRCQDELPSTKQLENENAVE